MVGSGQITGREFSWTLNFKGKTRLKSTGTSPGTLDFSFWSWDFFLCSSTCCAPGLKTPSRHSGLLGPSIWTMYSPQDFSDSPEAGFHFPFFGFDFGLGLGLGLVNITVCIANYLKANQTCIRQGQAQEFGNWTLDFFYGLGLTQGYQLDPSLSLRLLKPFFDNVLLEHGGLSHVLPLAVYLVVHKILETPQAQVLGLFWDSDFGIGLVNVSDLVCLRPQTDEILETGVLARVL